MNAATSWSHSTVRIAVRGLGTTDVRYCAAPWDHKQGWTRKEQNHALNYMIQLTGAKECPEPYVGFYDDWAPWQPKDPITLLGDLVRLVRQDDLARLVA